MKYVSTHKIWTWNVSTLIKYRLCASIALTDKLYTENKMFNLVIVNRGKLTPISRREYPAQLSSASCLHEGITTSI